MKRIFSFLNAMSLLAMQCTPVLAGQLFNVSSAGINADANITLCLNAKGPLSCQIYQVSGINLKISTNIPNHLYPTAGIRVNTPGFTILPSGCTPMANGFCTFRVSDTAAANLNIIGPISVDYIVVGAGTAGAVIAKQLSNDLNSSVIALHNGPNLDNNPLIRLSKYAAITVLMGLIGPPLYAISYTIAQPFADDQKLSWVYALPLGGASSVNAGAWCRGTDQVYEQWEALAGPNWSVQRILDTYIALENYHGVTPNPAARGFNGPLPIRQEAHPSQVSLVFSQAMMQATGLPNVVDYNDPDTPIGVSTRLQYTQSGVGGVIRASSGITFLNPSVMNTNGSGVNGRKLQVIFNATANDIIWQGNKAVGVRFVLDGKTYKLYASKGIIVSAGIKSSSILMRSGIGPAELLHSLKIPVVYNNPNVGQGLSDQPHIILIYTSNPHDSLAGTSNNLGKLIAAMGKHELGRKLLKKIGEDIILRNGLFAQIAWLPAPHGDPTIRALRFATINPVPGITVGLFDLVQPESRGYIAINSRDPFIEPTMNLGILSNPEDLDLYIEGFQTYIKDMNEQLALIDPEYQMIFPDPDVLNNLQELTDFIRHEVGTNMHFQSHCKMAPQNQGGVVDETGHVYGVKNLLVADDSIVPLGMDGSPMASAYLIAANVVNLLLGG
jgi:choline dehydrogenase-like flavoprotein